MFDVCVNAKEKVIDNEIRHSTEKSFKESFILFSFTFSKQVRFFTPNGHIWLWMYVILVCNIGMWLHVHAYFEAEKEGFFVVCMF